MDNRLTGTVIFLFTAIALAAGLTVVAVGLVSWTAPVPDVRNSTKYGAEQRLRSKGFEVEVATRGVPAKDVGEVLEQDPAPNSEQEKGSTVTITVGERILIEVPDLAGTTLEEAERRVGENFRLEDDGEVSGEPEDAVINQNPRAGSQARLGSDISVVTSASQPLPLPPNGEIRYFTQDPAVEPFEIENSTGSNYLVKLVDANSGLDVLDVFVRKGSTVEVSVPLGSYVVEDASGADWYGYERYFGPETVYGKNDEVADFEYGGYSYGYTYRIYEYYYYR